MKTLSLCAVVASITLTWAQSGRAQDVLVDPQGVNNGGLTNALKFGSQEPQGRICAMTRFIGLARTLRHKRESSRPGSRHR